MHVLLLLWIAATGPDNSQQPQAGFWDGVFLVCGTAILFVAFAVTVNLIAWYRGWPSEGSTWD
jgi:hypothetical protein